MLNTVRETTTGPSESAAAAEWFRHWRSEELSRVDASGLCYLDYTGAALYPESVIRADAGRLQSVVLGNPHSENRASLAATSDIGQARGAILDFLGADPAEYCVVLTANTSGACRLVGESYPFGPTAPLVLSQDNHNSVNGIREFARRRGGRLVTVPLDGELRMLDAVGVLERHAGRGGGLFAFPAQSNFSGVRHPLSLVPAAQALGYRVLVDAAAFLPTSTIDFAAVRPDFVVLSLYKIAGYPTGVGALVARREALAELRRPWFAGGTVDWVTTSDLRHQWRSGVEAFEDGTPAYLAAGAVAPALAAVTRAGRTRLSHHLAGLMARLLAELGRLRHADGSVVITLYGPADTRDRGATVSFSVRRMDGTTVPFWDVETAARDAGLALRGGCFCNPGCAEAVFGLGPDRSGPCLDDLGEDFTLEGFAECLGSAVGAVRISLGLGSLAEDVDRAVAFLGGYSAKALAPRSA